MNKCDRIEFAHSISYPEDGDCFTPGIVVFFDEIMWLYGVAGSLDVTSISVNSVNQTTCFDITFQSELQLEKFDYVIATHGNMINIYGRNFTVSSNHTTDTSVSVSVQQCA